MEGKRKEKIVGKIEMLAENEISNEFPLGSGTQLICPFSDRLHRGYYYQQQILPFFHFMRKYGKIQCSYQGTGSLKVLSCLTVGRKNSHGR